MKPKLKLIVVVLLAVMTLGASAQEEIFDGKTLDGWTCEPADCSKDWKAEKKMLVGENAGEKGSIIWTTQIYKDFELELDYKTLTKDYDTGVFLRSESHQVQVGISRSLKKDMTACIYAPKDQRGNYPGVSDKVAENHNVGKWNTLKIIAKGKRIQTFLNEVPLVNYTAVVIPESGPIGLQLHGGVHMKVLFRNIRITEL